MKMRRRLRRMRQNVMASVPWDLVVKQKVTPRGMLKRSCFCVRSDRPYPSGTQGVDRFPTKAACMQARRTDSTCQNG